MVYQAKLKYLRISPRKVRLVADAIRGKKVDEAQAILNFAVKKGALPVLKLLNSALANAKSASGKTDKLFIAKITVDEGPSMKRVLPRAKGKGDVLKKRSSHITLVLDEIKENKKKKK